MASLLLVDDDDLVRESLAIRLADAGYEVVRAVHGGDAIAAFRAGSFDVVISDIFMPDVDGMELVRAIRRESRTVPIIVMTGGSQRSTPSTQEGIEYYLRVAKQFGGTMVIAKPFAPSRLLAMIDECLQMPSA